MIVPRRIRWDWSEDKRRTTEPFTMPKMSSFYSFCQVLQESARLLCFWCSPPPKKKTGDSCYSSPESLISTNSYCKPKHTKTMAQKIAIVWMQSFPGCGYESPIQMPIIFILSRLPNWLFVESPRRLVQKRSLPN